MITIKLPYSVTDEKFQDSLAKLRRDQSVVIRKSYNLFRKGFTQSYVQKSDYVKSPDLGSWFIQSGIMQGKYIFDRNKKQKVIFGGKSLFYKRLKGKISKEQFKQRRLSKLVV